MAKIALLIGISEYQPGFDPLPGTQTDIRAMQRVLQHPQMGGFDEVVLLPNPNKSDMELAIEKLLADRQRDDLVLLYFSGHGFKDEDGSLYFVTRTTEQPSTHKIYQSTAVSASVVQNWMSRSRCKRQVLVLDCCFSGAFAEGMKAKAINKTVDIAAQFGGEGRAVLTSSTALQYSFEQQAASIYTRYLVEGIETGAADTDSNGVITIDELHDYAKRKVQEAAPAMKPEIFAVKEGYTIVLARAPLGDPKLEYRKEVEQLAQSRQGQFSDLLLQTLDRQRQKLGLTAEEAEVINQEVLQPFRELEKRLQQYKVALLKAMEHSSSPSKDTRDDLLYLQRVLELQPEHVASIEYQVVQQTQRFPSLLLWIFKLKMIALSVGTWMRALRQLQVVSPIQLIAMPGISLAWRKGGIGILTLLLGLPIASLLKTQVQLNKPSDSVQTIPDRKSSEGLPQSKDLFDSPTNVAKDNNPYNASTSSTKAEEFFRRATKKADNEDYRGAIADFEQAIKLKPDYVEAFEERADARYNSGDKQGAVEDYTQIIKLKPDNAAAYYYRARIRAVLNDKQGAVEDYQKAAEFYQKAGNTVRYRRSIAKVKDLQQP